MAKLKTGDRVIYAFNDQRYNALVANVVEGFNRGTGVTGTHITLAYIQQGLKLPTVATGVTELTEGKKVGFLLDEDLDTVARRVLLDMNETKHYTDGSSASGPGPLPNLSPEQQDALSGTGAFYIKDGQRHPCPKHGEATHCRDCDKEMIAIGVGVPICEECLNKGLTEGHYFRGTGTPFPSAADLDAHAEEQKVKAATEPSESDPTQGVDTAEASSETSDPVGGPGMSATAEAGEVDPSGHSEDPTPADTLQASQPTGTANVSASGKHESFKEHLHHLGEEIVDGLGNAIGEAKFGE